MGDLWAKTCSLSSAWTSSASGGQKLLTSPQMELAQPTGPMPRGKIRSGSPIAPRPPQQPCTPLRSWTSGLAATRQQWMRLENKELSRGPHFFMPAPASKSCVLDGAAGEFDHVQSCQSRHAITL